MPALYLPLPGVPLADLLADPVRQALAAIGLPLHGLTVGAPFKELALRLADEASPRARQAGAANLLVRQGDAWYADTTDPEGVLLPLAAHQVPLADQDIAVIGCGGAGRAIAAALRDAGARVTLLNRSRARGESAATSLGLPFQPLAELDESQHSLIVHATPCADATDIPRERCTPSRGTSDSGESASARTIFTTLWPSTYSVSMLHMRKQSMASPGVSTMGSPRILKEVLSTMGTDVRLAKALISSW